MKQHELGRACGGALPGLVLLVLGLGLLSACSDDGGGGGGQVGVPVPGTTDMGTPTPGTTDMGTPTPGTTDMGTPTPGTTDMGTPMPGTAGTGGDQGGGTAPTFTAIYDQIIPSCAAGFCHGQAPSSAGNGNLQLIVGDKEGVYNALVNVVSTSDMCGGNTLVVPGDSANSLLFQKLSATPPCGLTMPVGSTLSPEHQQLIADWIDAGALNN